MSGLCYVYPFHLVGDVRFLEDSRTGGVVVLSPRPVSDALFKTLVQPVGELPGIELSVLSVAPSTRLMVRVATTARSVPVTEHIS